MKARDLIELLNNLTEEQKDLHMLLVHSDSTDEENYWLDSMEVSNTSASGYEVGGEIRFIGNI